MRPLALSLLVLLAALARAQWEPLPLPPHLPAGTVSSVRFTVAR